MMSTLGMVVAVAIIIGAAAGGFWYWSRVREKKVSLPKEKKKIAIAQEPIFRDENAIPKPPIAKIVEPKEESKEEEPEEPQVKTNEALDETARDNSASAQETLRDDGEFLENAGVEELDATGLPKHDPYLMELVNIKFKRPVTGSQLITYVQQAYDIAPHGLLRVLALESNSKQWFKPDAIGMFEAVAFYVQLASSHSAFNEVSLSTLYQQVFQRMEMNFDGVSEMKDIHELTPRTNYLQGLIKQFGVQITLLLRPIDTVSIDQFEQEATLLGFKRKSSKHYEKIGELVTDRNGRRLGNRKGTVELRWLDDKDVTISLNVPLIAPEEEPLKLLMRAANAFAAVFDAKIVGSNGKEIGSPTVSLLKLELDNFYKEMRAKDLEPGSLRAHRLLD